MSILADLVDNVWKIMGNVVTIMPSSARNIIYVTQISAFSDCSPHFGPMA